jgi:hypothetical protein
MTFTWERNKITMEESTNKKPKIEDFIVPIINTAIKLIIDPLGFFKNMAKSGGFIEPLIFIVAMGLISGILQAILAVLGLARGVAFSMAIASIVIAPVLMAIFGFIATFVLFIIWKIMGSRESFETAFRCYAYVSAIVPINTVISIIPYAGSVLGFVWMTYLIIIASVEVHKIKPLIAWIVFGAICTVLSVSAISSQFIAKKQKSEIQNWQNTYKEELQGVRPEKTGKATEGFLKSLQEGAGKK